MYNVMFLFCFLRKKNINLNNVFLENYEQKTYIIMAQLMISTFCNLNHILRFLGFIIIISFIFLIQLYK
jgi:hypothetical protein